MSILALILQILGIAAGAAQTVLKDPTATAADALAQALIQIASAANAAHQQVAGKPIDLTQLQSIDPVP
jgi:hypothetical protein